MIKDNNPHRTRQINKVIDYIHGHMDGDLSVGALAGRADMSTYHFVRVFRKQMGETLARYVTRRRLELAAALLLGDDGIPVSEVAYRCGFASPNVFCRNFKARFGITAQQYRRSKVQPDSKNRPSERTDGQAPRSYSKYFCSCKTIKTGEKMMDCTFEIKDIPGFRVIYCRHYGALDQMEGAFERLLQWAYPRGLVTAPGMQLLSVYHDNPEVTPTEKLTADAAMTVPGDVRTDGEIGQYEVSGGKYAVGRFEIGMEEFPDAWRAMFRLLDEHGCRCTEKHHYEIYRNNREEHPRRKWIVDICIPVELK